MGECHRSKEIKWDQNEVSDLDGFPNWKKKYFFEGHPWSHLETLNIDYILVYNIVPT